MADLTLRSLYPEDIDQVAGIESSLTGNPHRELLDRRLTLATVNPSAPFLDEIAEKPSAPQSLPENFITCAVVDGDKMAGYGFARVLEGEFGARKTIVELDDIGVSPEYQGKGIGARIVAGIEQRMAKRNFGTLRTEIAWSNLSMVGFFASSGFALASGQIIERGIASVGEEGAGCGSQCDCAESAGGDGAAGSRVKVRPLKWEDLASVDRIDAKLTGMDRSAYLAAKFREVLDETGVRVSLVAEQAGCVAGFIMARADFGEFGSDEKAALIDTIGVHPTFGGRGIGKALISQLLVQLAELKVASVRTKVDHENLRLWAFLAKHGFKPSQRLLLTKDIS